MNYINKAAFLHDESLDGSHFNAPPAFTSAFKFDRPADPFASHEVVFALRQRHLAELDALVQRVSMPDSPTYGHFLSRAEVAEMTAPSPVTVATVRAFLRRSGVGNVRATRFGEFIVASAPIVVWEAMFEVASSARAAPFPDPTARVHLPCCPMPRPCFTQSRPKEDDAMVGLPPRRIARTGLCCRSPCATTSLRP